LRDGEFSGETIPKKLGIVSGRAPSQ